MRLSKKAQSVIEYSMIIILVALGIIIVGPYVIRSLNAHLKTWEDVAEDSYSDPFQKGGTDFPPPRCRCQTIAARCGLCGCNQLQMLYKYVCKPLGCIPENDSCATDDRCCIFGACGGNGCEPWQKTVLQCGANPQPPNCQDAAECGGHCTGNIPDNSTPCPGDTAGVTVNTPWWGVTACTDTRKCEAVCNAGYYADSNGSCVQEPAGCTLDVNFAGDCITDKSCPKECPYVVSCNLIYCGNDPNDCISNNTTTGQLYFQEGNDCGFGFLKGKIVCSSKPPVGGLTSSNCPLSHCDSCKKDGTCKGSITNSSGGRWNTWNGTQSWPWCTDPCSCKSNPNGCVSLQSCN